MTLVSPPPIESTRLLIRRIARADLPALLEINGSDEVTALLPYATWRSLADGEAWFGRIEAMEATGLGLQFVIALKSSGAVVGACLLFRHDEASQRAELGYVLGRRHWGAGLMHEALCALLDAAFGVMALRRIEAEVNTRNPRSAATLRRLGFTNEGLLRQRWIVKGRAEDVWMHGLLRSEWLAPAARADRSEAR